MNYHINAYPTQFELYGRKARFLRNSALYTLAPGPSVAAVQWTGTNEQDMAEILGNRHFYADAESAAVFMDDTARRQRRATISDWIVQTDAGLVVMSDQQFTATYEAV